MSNKWSPFDWLRKPLAWFAWRILEWSCGLNTKLYYYRLDPIRKEDNPHA